MAALGEIKSAKELGHKGYYRYTEAPCIDCGKLRWVTLKHGIPRNNRCYSCSNKLGRARPMESNWNWRGGRRISKDGYIIKTISKDHPFFCMATGTHEIREHRLVLAEHLNRPLEPSELVHHINENKTDNRIENLELLSKVEHGATYFDIAKRLRQQLKVLESQINTLTQRLSNYEEV